MFCSHCGKEMDPAARFCPACGATTPSVVADRGPFPGQLTRPRYPRMIAGVCSGFALHYGWDLSLVRVVTALTIVLTGVGLFAYLAAWIIIPEAPYALPDSSGVGSAGPGV
jgi:phage shock protein PspC (stress-responsive transcriptional regulator)